MYYQDRQVQARQGAERDSGASRRWILTDIADKVGGQSRRKKMQVLPPLVQQARSILDVGSGSGGFLYPTCPSAGRAESQRWAA